MIIKAVLVFLLAMVGLAMVGRALGIGTRKTKRLQAPALCGDCGRLVAKGERCVCGAGPSA